MPHPYSDSMLSSSQYALRTIDQFEDRREILAALRDAVIENREEWLTTGTSHGNIDFNAILINESGRHGYLVNPPSPSDSKFASARSLDRARRRRLFSRHYDNGFDYVDDLESFYHVTGWICCVFEAPHQYKLELPGLLKLHMNPTRVTRIAIKRELIMHNGYETCSMTPYFSEDESVFPVLLQRMQAIVRRGYKRDENQDRRLKPLQKRAQAEHDYKTFIDAIDDALFFYDSADVDTPTRNPEEEVQGDSEEGRSVEELDQVIADWMTFPSIGSTSGQVDPGSDSGLSESSCPPLTPTDAESVAASKELDLPHPSVFGATEYPSTSLQYSVDDSGLTYTYLPSPVRFEFVFDI